MNPVKRVLRRLRCRLPQRHHRQFVSEDFASRHQATTVRETKER